ncbi:MAG: Eco57I restriction-modification methylase domain-containing protein [Acidobacteriaceae bacterium]|nr:Eco57I restriction-modification methylase domain-containing protein [Acidobacteriaceae bacterium]
MCNSVERALKEHFNLNLSSAEVVILDPCTGTGNFIVNLIQRIPGSALREAYHNRLFANEVMLLPYYVASLNIEHAFYERMRSYESFDGLCFVDTLDMSEPKQKGLFTAANTERVERENSAAITVIVGNPPYNVAQKSENDNNRNRKYKVVDARIRDTYTKDSKATNKNSLSDMYVKFFRWATDRLENRDGIVCFVSNNSFVDQHAFDGMRKHLAQDFQIIDHVDLHGNVRRNPKISGTTHNVFGIQVGVGITLGIKKAGLKPTLRYFRVPEMWRRREKLDFLAQGKIDWREIHADARHTWIIPENSDEYGAFIAIADLFQLRSRGLETTRDEVVYDFSREKLITRVTRFIKDYNAEVDRHRRDKNADFPDHLKWSSRLKECLARGQYAEYSPAKIREALYRPFTKKWVFFDSVLNQRTGQWPSISGPVIWVKVGAGWPFFALTSDLICDLLPQGGSQCFPLSHLKDSAVDRFMLQYTDASITKTDVFQYIYGVLHHPGYRSHYAENLKRELPRIPFAPDFHAFADAGKQLAHLHVGYESLEPWPLEHVERKDVPYSERVTKMKLSKDRTSIQVNDSLTLAGIPAEAFDYRLGSKSAIEWIVDQYQVKGESDPNREDDPGYIVRSIGQIVRVSVETVRIVATLPDFRPNTPAQPSH